MKQYVATLDTAQIQLCCKKGRFTFYNGEVISDGEIARLFPKYFLEINPDPVVIPEPTVPENFVGFSQPIEEPVVEEVQPEPEVEEAPVVDEVVEAAEEEVEEVAQEEDASEPQKERKKPGRKPKQKD